MGFYVRWYLMYENVVWFQTTLQQHDYRSTPEQRLRAGPGHRKQDLCGGRGAGRHGMRLQHPITGNYNVT